MSHWIKASSDAGYVFECSKCGGRCHCIVSGTKRAGRYNLCDYDYCPRCGAKMDLNKPTTKATVEAEIYGYLAPREGDI